MKQIGLGLANYESTNSVYPSGSMRGNDANTCSSGNTGWSLFSAILPFIEQTNVYNSLNYTSGTGASGILQRTGLITRVNSYVCPSDTPQTPFTLAQSNNGYSQSSYAGMMGSYDVIHYYCGCAPGNYGYGCNGGNTWIQGNGMFSYAWTIPLALVTDGTSNTIYVGEQDRFPGNTDPDAVFNSWSRAEWFSSNASGVTRIQGMATSGPAINAKCAGCPTTLANGQFGFRSNHPGGANFLFGDGSVHFLKQTINYNVYWAVSTKNFGEVLSADSY
jgi:prepilin-type processing-associated H-X9-DG protein